MKDAFSEPKVVDAELVVDGESRKWAMFCHLSALIGFLVPFASLVAPTIVWQSKKDVSSFVDQQGKESVNFQLTIVIGLCVCFVLKVILIGFILFGLLIIWDIVWTIMAGLEANAGKTFRYPYTIRFIK